MSVNNNSANSNSVVRNVGATIPVNNSPSTNNLGRNVGAAPHFGNSGIVPQTRPMNHHGHLLSQPQPQIHSGSHFSGHFQLSEPQARTMSHVQYTQAHTQAQAQSAHAHLQAHTQPVQLHSANASNVSITSSISTPGTGSSKRPSQKPPSRPAGSSNTSASSPFKTMELAPATRRKKVKLPEKQITDKVASLLPESAIYTQLLEVEDRIDAALARKKKDIQESLKNPSRIQKTLRIYVFNTFENQNRNNSDQNSVDSPSWSLKIIGRILEDGKDPVITGAMQNYNSTYPKFSSFFKKITIYLDQSLYPDNHIILWESARSPVLQEGFEVKRKGDKEFTAVIRLDMNYTPEKFRLSPSLSDVLGIETDTRSRIMAALWHYVKANKLQSSNDPSFITCDTGLRKVLGEEKVKFSMVSQKISQHLIPPQPINLQHRVKISGNSPVGTTCYDVVVDVPFPIEKQKSAFLANLEKHKDIDSYDELITAAVRKLHEHGRRRAFFLGFSQSPADFINNLISSQTKDLKIVAGDASRLAEKERHSNFYSQSWVEDAVIRYLNRKPSGSDVPGNT
ncbi:unnamed protein product [Citrullus colocynthis]|uniref:DM2 domain-containing protein n=1 Tax=Citrullus colocynthis TaxID=252529 RepID=A0ABP0XLU0_9ROSI